MTNRRSGARNTPMSSGRQPRPSSATSSEGTSSSGGFRHESPVGASVEWFTPPGIFEALGIEFDLDPAAPAGGVPWVPAKRYFTREDDGLAQPWCGRCWVNPPYGRSIARWLTRLAVHGDGIALVFARSDTIWFQTSVARATAICFVAGRLKFIPGDGRTEVSTAGAPSMLLAYGLPCAIALTESNLGQTFLVPTSGSRDEVRDCHSSIRQSGDVPLDTFAKANETGINRSQ